MSHPVTNERLNDWATSPFNNLAEERDAFHDPRYNTSDDFRAAVVAKLAHGLPDGGPDTGDKGVYVSTVPQRELTEDEKALQDALGGPAPDPALTASEIREAKRQMVKLYGPMAVSPEDLIDLQKNPGPPEPKVQPRSYLDEYHEAVKTHGEAAATEAFARRSRQAKEAARNALRIGGE